MSRNALLITKDTYEYLFMQRDMSMEACLCLRVTMNTCLRIAATMTTLIDLTVFPTSDVPVLLTKSVQATLSHLQSTSSSVPRATYTRFLVEHVLSILNSVTLGLNSLIR